MSVKKKNSIWFIRFTHKGKEFTRSAGKGATKQEALAIEQAMLKECRDMDNGFVPDRTIEEALARWLEEHVIGNEGLVGVDKYRSHINCILPYIENQPLNNIHVVASTIAAEMKASGFAASTIRNRLNPLKQAAKYSYKFWNWLSEPLQDKFPTVKGMVKRDTFLSVDQVNSLAGACETELAKSMIYFLAYTGLRCGEMWRLNEDSLGGANNDILSIAGKCGARAIPLNQEQSEFVEKHIPLQVTYSYLRYHFNRAKKAIDLPDIRPHDLRHTYGTMLAEAGVDRNAIMELMGHSTVEQSKVYTRLSVNHLRGLIPKQNARPAPDSPARIRPALRVILA